MSGREFRAVDPSIWEDEYFCGLSDAEVLVYFWLICNVYITDYGYIESTHPEIISKEINCVSQKQVSDILDKFERDGKILRHGYNIYVRYFLAHQEEDRLVFNEEILAELKSDSFKIPEHIESQILEDLATIKKR